MIQNGYAIGQSSKIHELFHQIDVLSKKNRPLLISGNPGAGDFFYAKRIHGLSLRADLKFDHWDAKLISSDEILESITKKIKSFQKRGTVFIENIDELDLSVQSWFFQYLKDHQNPEIYEPRFIFSSSKDLEKLVSQYKFHKKFYQLIKKFELVIPKLNQRKEDIIDLINLIIRAKENSTNLDIYEIFTHLLKNYDWPGNTHELTSFVDNLLYLKTKNSLDFSDINSLFYCTQKSENMIDTNTLSYTEAIESFEKKYLLAHLEIEGWNQAKTAEKIGVHRKTLENKIKKYDLSEIILGAKNQQKN
jgi:DNA-binding NtrC family response regulator